MIIATTRIVGRHARERESTNIFYAAYLTFRIIQEFNTSMVIISQNEETTTFLRLRASALQTPLSDDDIHR